MGPRLFAPWLLLLSFLHFANGGYQHLMMQELSATFGHSSVRTFVYLVFALANVFYGLGAALNARLFPDGVAGRRIRILTFLTGLATLVSVVAALSVGAVRHGALLAPMLAVLLPVAVVLLLHGLLAGALFTHFRRHYADRIGVVVASALVALLLGYLAGGTLGIRPGVNVCLFMLAALLALASLPGRVPASVVMLAVAALVVVFREPTRLDRLLERLRPQSFTNLKRPEIEALERGDLEPLQDGWSNTGKLNIYRIRGTGWVLGCYNSQHVWNFGDQHAEYAEFYARLGPRDRALIIALGAGDLLGAFPKQQLANVTGVEISREVVEFFRRRPELNDRLFLTMDVRARDGRAVLDEAEVPYELILMHNASMGTQPLANLVAFDDYLSTREAFTRALELLTPSGLLVFVSNWRIQIEQAASALVEIGARPRIYWDQRRSPRYDVLVSGVRERGKGTRGVVVTSRTGTTPPVFASSMNWREAHLGELPPPRTDDRPHVLHPLMSRWAGRQAQGLLALAVIAAVLSFAAVGATMPWPSRHRGQGRSVGLRYFARIGVGYVLLQFSLVARFRSFFGDPLYTALIVNSFLFLFSGLGSLATSRALRWIRRSWLVWTVLGLVLALTHVSMSHIPFHVSHPVAKLAVCAVVVAPIATVVGMGLPLGLLSIPSRSVGLALLVDSVGAFLAVPVFYLTAWFLGISYNLLWVAGCYAGVGWSVTRSIGFSDARPGEGVEPKTT